MSRTYSAAFRVKEGYWVTNWGQYFSLDDIADFAKRRGYLAYGYYYGHNSRNLTSARCRTVFWERGQE